MLQVWVLLMGLSVALGQDNRFLGCYKDLSTNQSYSVPQPININLCIGDCKGKYFRYARNKNGGFCTCTNYLGEEVNNTKNCAAICQNCNGVSDVYITGNLVPGPPQNVQLTALTNTSVHIAWNEPKSFMEITSYRINAIVLHTFASYTPNREWWNPNDTLRTSISLLPATKYNITLAAVSPDGPGAIFSQIIETYIGEPENTPSTPKVIKRYDDKAEIQIMGTTNGNGPITSYLVVVVNKHHSQVFQEELLKKYDDAKLEGTSYYIAAELNPESIKKNFLVGDGKYYGKYYNAPLEKGIEYNFVSGIVSSFNGKVKRAFSALDVDYFDDSTETTIQGVNKDSPALIIGLSIAIALLSFMFIAGIIGFIILKSRVTHRRQALSDNLEFTIQGPMIEVENNGYIPEEEHTKINYYKNLKQKVRTIPHRELKIEPTNLLGIGRFGRVNSGSIYENNTLIPVAAYSISDKKLSTDDKKTMLRDLDVLIKSDKHENVLALIGTCETAQMVVVVLEYVSMNLKDLLLGSRDSLPGRFSNMSENQALDIAIYISKGMFHLEVNKIIHKQLCARNIMIANGFVPKISGFGLAQYYSHNNLPDYTRWTALEVFREQPHNVKSDVWSFGCLLWEICVLGGTPYGNFSNNEIPERVTKGLRLPQMQYFSDEFYQIMLNCWQIDMDERPRFSSLIESLEVLKENALIPCLNFNLYQNFQYEQFYPDMEVAVRPVF